MNFWNMLLKISFIRRGLKTSLKTFLGFLRLFFEYLSEIKFNLYQIFRKSSRGYPEMIKEQRNKQTKKQASKQINKFLDQQYFS